MMPPIIPNKIGSKNHQLLLFRISMIWLSILYHLNQSTFWNHNSSLDRSFVAITNKIPEPHARANISSSTTELKFPNMPALTTSTRYVNGLKENAISSDFESPSA